MDATVYRLCICAAVGFLNRRSATSAFLARLMLETGLGQKRPVLATPPNWDLGRE
jgi:hypothetical protein